MSTSNDPTEPDVGATAPEPESVTLPIEPPFDPGAVKKIGCFQIKSKIGHGGMGVVYRALDETLQRIVAVKFIRHSLSDSASTKHRFLREARAAAAVSHPNIVTVHRIDEFQGMPYIVMEYVDGMSLHKLISNGPRLSSVPLLQLILQIVDGLQAAHGNGIIHRDIKPSNILVEGGSGRPKISDFGLARIGGEAMGESSEAHVAGTPSYMSPEQFKGGKIDARSDLFSLGCLIHALVVGRSPFEGSHFAETASKILESTPPPLSQSSPGIPLVLSTIVSKLLEKEPENRYQSAREVANELRKALHEQQRDGDLPMIETMVISSPSLRRRRRTLAGLGVLALLVLLAGGAFLVPGIRGQLSTYFGTTTARRVRTVSQSGPAEFSSIQTAINAAVDGDTIRIADSGEYAERVRIRSAKNLTVEATNGAALISPSEGRIPLEIVNSEDIVIRGLEIRTVTDKEDHAVYIVDSEGCRLEDLKIRHPKDIQHGAITLEGCNSRPGSREFVISGCDVEAMSSGQCLWITGDQVSNLVIERNRFRESGGGTVAAMLIGGGNVVIRNNLFDRGIVGLNLWLRGKGSGRVIIANNVFTRCENWIGFMSTDPTVSPFVLVNNLVISSKSIEDFSNVLGDALQSCTIGGNVWERSRLGADDPPDLGRLAEIVDVVDVVSRSEGDPAYLKLPADSPWLKKGIGGEFPEYVGRDPASSE